MKTTIPSQSLLKYSILLFILFFIILDANGTVLPGPPTLPPINVNSTSSYVDGGGNAVQFTTTLAAPSGNGAFWTWNRIDASGTIISGNLDDLLGYQLDSDGTIVDDVLNPGPNNSLGVGDVIRIRVFARDGGPNANEFDSKDYVLVVVDVDEDCFDQDHDFALVLDASGSMNSPTMGTTRWGQLRDAVTSYLPTLGAFLEDDNNLQVAFFKTGVNGNTIQAYNGNFGNLGNPNSLFNNVSPGGGTPMGDGILSVFPGFSATSRNIIVLSDGHENVNPEFDTANNSIGSRDFDDNPDSGNDNDVRIFTIGVGGSDEAKLQALAHPNNNAFFAHSYDSDEMDLLFASTIPSALFGCSPRFVTYRTGTLQGFESEQSQNFLVDSLVEKLVVKISVNDPSQDSYVSENAQLYKDGIRIPARPQFINNNLFFFVDLPYSFQPAFDVKPAVPFTYIDGGGEWEIRFSGTKGAEYKLSVLVEDKYLKTNVEIESTDLTVVGDDLRVLSTVSIAGKPVMEGIEVTALLLRPGEDLGDLAAATTVDTSVLNLLEATLADNTNQSTLYGQAKIDFLLNNPEILAQLVPEDRSTILTHQQDGEYIGFFGGDENFNTGTYRVVVNYKGSIPGFGEFEGVDFKWMYFDFGRFEDIDAQVNLRYVGRTPPLKELLAQDVYTLQLTPVNKFGKKLGPGKAHRINALVGDQPVVLTDNLDGTYTATVNVPANRSPDLNIFVVDPNKPVYTESLDDAVKKSRFGFSLHGGYVQALNDTPPFDDLKEGVYTELDLTYEFNPKWALELVGGNYRFDTDYQLWGANLMLEYSFAKIQSTRVLTPKLGIGLGLFKPDNIDLTYSLALRGGLMYDINSNLEAGLNIGVLALPDPNFTFGYGGLGIKYFF